MSLTGTHHIFGGISETGIDHFLNVFFTARPHLLAYGTPFFAGNPQQRASTRRACRVFSQAFNA